MQQTTEQQIKFSIRVMIINKEGKVLLGLKKKGFHCNNWIFPGGQMDFGETVPQCGEREVWEETALEVKIKGLIDIVSETQGVKHVVFINLLADGEGQPVVTEPKEIIEWHWFQLNEIPANATASVQNAIKKIKCGQPIIPI
ncbi:MAG: NUDIX domain-containing protein [Bacillota bacterium]